MGDSSIASVSGSQPISSAVPVLNCRGKTCTLTNAKGNDYDFTIDQVRLRPTVAGSYRVTLEVSYGLLSFQGEITLNADQIRQFNRGGTLTLTEQQLKTLTIDGKVKQVEAPVQLKLA